MGDPVSEGPTIEQHDLDTGHSRPDRLMLGKDVRSHEGVTTARRGLERIGDAYPLSAEHRNPLAVERNPGAVGSDSPIEFRQRSSLLISR